MHILQIQQRHPKSNAKLQKLNVYPSCNVAKLVFIKPPADVFIVDLHTQHSGHDHSVMQTLQRCASTLQACNACVHRAYNFKVWASAGFKDASWQGFDW